MEEMETDKEASPTGFSRRDALVKAAKLGGALAWTVPLVQTVDIRAAAAMVGTPAADPGHASGPPADSGAAGHGGTSGETGETDGAGGGGGTGAGGAAPGGGGAGGTTTGTPLQVLQLTASPNPLRIGSSHRLRIGFYVSTAAVVHAMIVRDGRVIRAFQTRELKAGGWVLIRWNGKNRRGRDVPTGRYNVVVQAEDTSGALSEAKLKIRIAR